MVKRPLTNGPLRTNVKCERRVAFSQSRVVVSPVSRQPRVPGGHLPLPAPRSRCADTLRASPYTHRPESDLTH